AREASAEACAQDAHSHPDEPTAKAESDQSSDDGNLNLGMPKRQMPAKNADRGRPPGCQPGSLRRASTGTTFEQPSLLQTTSDIGVFGARPRKGGLPRMVEGRGLDSSLTTTTPGARSCGGGVGFGFGVGRGFR